jgi:hypothetical protein
MDGDQYIILSLMQGTFNAYGSYERSEAIALIETQERIPAQGFIPAGVICCLHFRGSCSQTYSTQGE